MTARTCSVSLFADLLAAVRRDPEFVAALLVLDDPRLRVMVRLHVDARTRSIDWDAIEASCHAVSDRLMVGAARALWDRSATCSFGRLVAMLGNGSFERVMSAARGARGTLTCDQALTAFEVVD